MIRILLLMVLSIVIGVLVGNAIFSCSNKLSSCCNKQISTSPDPKDQFSVEFLFEKDGIKVYRFWDRGSSHYFTNKGETMTQQSQGKTTYEENIK